MHELKAWLGAHNAGRVSDFALVNENQVPIAASTCPCAYSNPGAAEPVQFQPIWPMNVLILGSTINVGTMES